MPKVQCGVSVPPLPDESVAEGTLTGPVLAPFPHNRSLKSRLSLGVGDPERRNLADLFGPMGHACQKCNVASQCHRFRLKCRRRYANWPRIGPVTP
ncbi:hypothetical protein DPMN_193684 [Dreissena polymorpha]|uniref:Uncharacterized protein n=1 Tax=Dreissena polymorpha TaxID=45954 RepID=A0A9D4BBP1_DREPO|nr:hypothetical protein DPMN_193684 [Dreissena polymorpha]